jgi:hypothetical protein
VIDHDDFFDAVQLFGDPTWSQKAAFEDGNFGDTAASEAPASATRS